MAHPLRKIDTAAWRHANNFFTKFCRTITISPDFPVRYYLEHEDNGVPFEYSQQEVYFLLSAVKQSMDKGTTDYILIPEFSDEGRLHFHGVVKFKYKNSIVNFLKSDARLMTRRLGQTKLDGIPHPAWINYMFKDYLKTEDHLEIMALEPECYIPYMPCKNNFEDFLEEYDDEGNN